MGKFYSNLLMMTVLAATAVTIPADAGCGCRRQKPPNLYDKNRQMLMMRRYLPNRVAYYRFRKKCYEKRHCSVHEEKEG